MWKKVAAPTILVSLLWITVSMATTWYINWLMESHTRILAENVTTIEVAGRMQHTLWKLYAAVAEPNADGVRHNALRAEEQVEAFRAQLAEAERTAFTEKETPLVNAIRNNFTLLEDFVHQHLAGQDGASFYLPPSAERLSRLALAVTEPCLRLSEVNERLLAEENSYTARLGTYVKLIRFVFLFAGPVVGLLLGLWVARGLQRSISEVSINLCAATGEMEEEVGLVRIHPSAGFPALNQQVQAVSQRIRQVVEDLHQARRETMRAERLAAVGELAAGVAHELRNPLTSVKLLVQTAAQRYPHRSLTEKQLHVIQEEILRMEKTIQGLLDFARPRELHRVAHDLRDTLRRAVNLVEGRANRQRVTITEAIPSAPVILQADAEQLHQVFVNLLLNGIESMTPDGGELRLSLETCQEDGVHRVTFADAGSGIPDAILGRLFEPFITSKDQGTGLGLAISRRIISQHGGRLSGVNRQDGRGAVFTVELPSSAAPPGDGVTDNTPPQDTEDGHAEIAHHR